MSTEAKPPRAIAHLLAGLADPEDAAQLVGLAFDFGVDQPVKRFVVPERVLEHAERALQPEVVERWVRDHLRPSLDRERTRAHRRGDRVRDWLTPESIAELRSIVARPVRLKRDFLEGVVKQDAVRHMLRGIIEETLQRFVQMLKPSGSGGGLVGAVGRSAFGLAGGLLGGIGDKIEQTLPRLVATFLESSMNAMLERVVALASTPEAAANLGKAALNAFDGALGQKTGAVADAAHRAPLDDLLALLPEIVAHNIARPEVRAGLLEEVHAALAVEGERPIRALLDEAGTTTLWRSELIATGAPLVNEWSASAPFRAWIAAHSK